MLAGCAGSQGVGGQPPAPLPGTQIQAPQGGLTQPTWLDDGWIYFVLRVQDVYRQQEIWRAKPDTKAEQVNLPPLDGCRLTRWNNLHRLPDGRLGLVRECLTEDVRNDWSDVVAYSPETGKVETIATLGSMTVSTLTWTSDLKSGYASYTSSICATVSPVTTNGIQRFTHPVEIDGRRWTIDAEFFRPTEESCVDDGRAYYPILLPDDKTLLLAASPTSQGRSGAARTREPWHIYRWVPGEGNPERLAQGFGDPLGFDITSDGKWAFIASSHRGKDGVWAINLSSGDVREIAIGLAKGVTISPDGKRALVEFEPQTGDPMADMYNEQLRVIDLNGLL